MPIHRPYLRDGIDVYVRGEGEVHFVYLASRKRVVLKAESRLIQTLAWLDGQHTASELSDRFVAEHGSSVAGQFISFLAYLEQGGIIIDLDWMAKTGIDADVAELQQRQLAFLLDILGTPDKVAEAQIQMSSAKLVCFGVGAVGSWLVRLLLGLGFRNFVLVDHAEVGPSDVARHAFFAQSSGDSGQSKVSTVAEAIRAHFPSASIRAVDRPLATTTQLSDLIASDTSLVINAADEPYIGYTSVLLSRYCIPRRMPLFIAGGFDAHLGSVGEMIIAGVTPCADCYADYFKEALTDWKPVPHPVIDRHDGSGGLCSLSVFAAAAAAMGILRHFTSQGIPSGVRGEFLFDEYRLDTFTVPRRAGCLVCSGA